MTVKFSTVKNELDSFFAKDNKTGEQIKATVLVNGKEFSGMGNTEKKALQDLQDRINDYYNAQKHIAKTEINKATGQRFFD